MKPSLKNIFHKLTGPTESDVVLMPDQVWRRKFTPWRRKRKNTWRTWTWSIVKGKQNDWKRSEKKPEVGVAEGGGSPAHWALSLSSCVQMPGTVRGRAASSPIPTITVTRHSTVSRTTPVTFDPLPEVSVSCRDSTETAPVPPPPPRSPSVYLQPEPLPSMFHLFSSHDVPAAVLSWLLISSHPQVATLVSASVVMRLLSTSRYQSAMLWYHPNIFINRSPLCTRLQ